MATVNILDAFTYKWGQLGTVEAISDAQWKTGWAFIGAVPPSVEQFNKFGQIFDEKSNYLYAQLKTVYDLAGVVPSAVDVNSLRDSLRGTGLFVTQTRGDSTTKVATTAFVQDAIATAAPRVIRFTGSTTWLCPAGVTKIYVSAIAGGSGGGAGGGNSGGQLSFGVGGGGGGGGGCGQYLLRQAFTVVPGVTYTITVGVGGAGGTASGAGGAGGAGFVGTLTSMTAPGPVTIFTLAPGAAPTGGQTPTADAINGGGGGGSGGLCGGSAVHRGSYGTDGNNTGNGGVGASSPFGGGGGSGAARTTGGIVGSEAAANSGAGGGGGGGGYIKASTNVNGATGGKGADGIVILEY